MHPQKDAGLNDPHQSARNGRRAVKTKRAAAKKRAAKPRRRDLRRRQSEGPPHSGEEPFRLLADAMPQLVWTADAAGAVDYFNARREEYADRKSDALNWNVLIHPDDLQRTIEVWRHAVETGSIYECEHRIKLRDGSYCWHLSRAIPMRDAKGRVVKWFGTATDIDETIRAEERHRESERRFRQFAAATNAVIWISDAATGKVEYVSPALERVWGLDPAEDRVKWLHPDDRQRAIEARERTAKGEVVEIDYRIVRPDGEVRFISDVGFPIRDRQGVVVRVGVIARDVTRAKRREQALRESRDRLANALAELETIYRTSPIGLCTLSPDLRFLHINDRMSQRHGVPAADHIGRTLREIAPAIADEAEAIVRSIIETGEPRLNLEFTETADGERRTWSEHWAPIKTQEGEVVGINVAAKDITERKRAEESNALLAAIVMSSGDAIFSSGLDRTLRSWNAGAERLYGYTAEEAIGQPLSIIAPDHLKQELHDLSGRALNGEPVYFETLRQRKDGSLVAVGASAAPIRAADGRVIGASAVHRDITENKRHEEQMRFMVRELSHRSKNLLAVVQAMARETAKACEDFSQFEDRFTGRIQALAHSHDLLVAHNWQAALLRSLVEAQLAPFAGADKMRISVRGPAVWIRPEATQYLGMALYELASNAIRHGALSSPAGSVSIEWTSEPGGGARLTWRERGGPDVAAPARRGFGRTVLERMAAAHDSTAKLSFAPEGLVWSMSIPSHQIAPAPGA